MVESGSEGGASLFLEAVKETWREGSLAGDPEGYVAKSVETGISLHRGPAGEPG